MIRNILSIADQIQLGHYIHFDLEHKAIQFFKNLHSLNPLRFSTGSDRYVCNMITDADSCFQIACVISAVLGLIIGEGVQTKTGIMYEFKQRG